jgi:O-methyltransferase
MPASIDQIAKSALAHRETVEATYDIACTCIERDVPGDFVECGVYAGAQCAVMALALLHHGAPGGRRVHLFDSFEGLPAATPTDEEIWQHHGAKTGEAACSLEDVMRNMEAWGIPEGLLVYHKGWFSHTISHALASIKAIALLRLDADLYESTEECMQLYPLVSRGGWVIIDDWNLTGTRKAVNELVVPAPIYWRIPTK